MANSNDIHTLEWVAIYTEDDTRKILYQFDESSEYYDKKNGLIPFVPIVMDILNKENRLFAFYMIIKGSSITDINNFPRYGVILEDGSFHINGQSIYLLPRNIELTNYRLIWYFSPAIIHRENGTVDKMVRLYKLGLQANDINGKNYQKIMILNMENEIVTIQDNR